MYQKGRNDEEDDDDVFQLHQQQQRHRQLQPQSETSDVPSTFYNETDLESSLDASQRMGSPPVVVMVHPSLHHEENTDDDDEDIKEQRKIQRGGQPPQNVETVSETQMDTVENTPVKQRQVPSGATYDQKPPFIPTPPTHPQHIRHASETPPSDRSSTRDSFANMTPIRDFSQQHFWHHPGRYGNTSTHVNVSSRSQMIVSSGSYSDPGEALITSKPEKGGRKKKRSSSSHRHQRDQQQLLLKQKQRKEHAAFMLHLYVLLNANGSRKRYASSLGELLCATESEGEEDRSGGGQISSSVTTASATSAYHSISGVKGGTFSKRSSSPYTTRHTLSGTLMQAGRGFVSDGVDSPTSMINTLHGGANEMEPQPGTPTDPLWNNRQRSISDASAANSFTATQQLAMTQTSNSANSAQVNGWSRREERQKLKQAQMHKPVILDGLFTDSEDEEEEAEQPEYDDNDDDDKSKNEVFCSSSCRHCGMKASRRMTRFILRYRYVFVLLSMLQVPMLLGWSFVLPALQQAGGFLGFLFLLMGGFLARRNALLLERLCYNFRGNLVVTSFMDLAEAAGGIPFRRLVGFSVGCFWLAVCILTFACLFVLVFSSTTIFGALALRNRHPSGWFPIPSSSSGPHHPFQANDANSEEKEESMQYFFRVENFVLVDDEFLNRNVASHTWFILLCLMTLSWFCCALGKAAANRGYWMMLPSSFGSPTPIRIWNTYLFSGFSSFFILVVISFQVILSVLYAPASNDVKYNIVNPSSSSSSSTTSSSVGISILEFIFQRLPQSIAVLSWCFAFIVFIPKVGTTHPFFGRNGVVANMLGLGTGQDMESGTPSAGNSTAAAHALAREQRAALTGTHSGGGKRGSLDTRSATTAFLFSMFFLLAGVVTLSVRGTNYSVYYSPLNGLISFNDSAVIATIRNETTSSSSLDEINPSLIIVRESSSKNISQNDDNNSPYHNKEFLPLLQSVQVAVALLNLGLALVLFVVLLRAMHAVVDMLSFSKNNESTGGGETALKRSNKGGGENISTTGAKNQQDEESQQMKKGRGKHQHPQRSSPPVESTTTSSLENSVSLETSPLLGSTKSGEEALPEALCLNGTPEKKKKGVVTDTSTATVGGVPPVTTVLPTSRQPSSSCFLLLLHRGYRLFLILTLSLLCGASSYYLLCRGERGCNMLRPIYFNPPQFPTKTTMHASSGTLSLSLLLPLGEKEKGKPQQSTEHQQHQYAVLNFGFAAKRLYHAAAVFGGIFLPFVIFIVPPICAMKLMGHLQVGVVASKDSLRAGLAAEDGSAAPTNVATSDNNNLNSLLSAFTNTATTTSSTTQNRGGGGTFQRNCSHNKKFVNTVATNTLWIPLPSSHNAGHHPGGQQSCWSRFRACVVSCCLRLPPWSQILYFACASWWVVWSVMGAVNGIVSLA